MASGDAYVHGGDDICNVLDAVVRRAELVVTQQAAAELQQQRTRLLARAQAHPRWQGLASDISMWTNEEGNATFGLPTDHERHDQAVRAEYGDDKNVPAPLLRMGLASDVVDMGWSMTEAFQRKGF